MNLFDDTSQEQGQRLKGCDSSFSGPGGPPIPVSDWECVLGWTSAAPFSVLLTSYKNDSRYLILRAGNEGFKVIRCAGFAVILGPRLLLFGLQHSRPHCWPVHTNQRFNLASFG